MTQISARRLDEETQKRMYRLFAEVIQRTNTMQDVENLLNDMFTPNERIMLPKRICIAYLLKHGYTHRQISSYVNVSFTTINRISTVLATGGRGYAFVLDTIKNNKSGSTILDAIGKGIISFLADMNGPSAVWKNLNRG